jgi:hypothetical protein
VAEIEAVSCNILTCPLRMSGRDRGCHADQTNLYKSAKKLLEVSAVFYYRRRFLDVK